MSQFREELQKALKKIDRPGLFCVSGNVPFVLPGLTIQGIGSVGLPFNAMQAKEVIKHCEQAPYGKGEQTLIDTNVRKVWHLTPEKFSLGNPDWAGCIEQILGKVQEGLGLAEKLEAHLYDLLIYEPGSFFLPHRDSEKLERMVATLVVVLPSSFKGGELVVRHDGQEQVIDASEDAGKFRVHYSAFYADCEHELRPLTEGYRLALVYNVVLTKGPKGLNAPRSSEHIAPIRDILRGWAAADDVPEKLAITLDHRYTQDGLVWDALKGIDRTRADVVAEAARQANWRVHLALVTYYESGYGHDLGGGDDFYGRRRYGDEEENIESGPYEMIDVNDAHLTVDHWSTPSGERVNLQEIHLEEEEILDYEVIEGIDPEEDYEGYTGNAGQTLQRWYRHGALILWTAAKDFNLSCGIGRLPDRDVLALMVNRWEKTDPRDEQLKTQCIEFAKALLAGWAQKTGGWREFTGQCRALVALAKLGDLELIRTYIREVLSKPGRVETDETLVDICEKYGWATFQKELEAAFAATSGGSIERNLRLLEALGAAKPAKKAKEWQTLCEKLGKQVVPAFEGLESSLPLDHWERRNLKRAGLLTGLTRFLVIIQQSPLLDHVTDHALKDETNYPLETHLQALTELQPWFAENVKAKNTSLSRWVAAVRERFEKLTAREPKRPTDFGRPSNLNCACEFCKPFARFLASPTESTYRLSGRDHRKHIEDIIKREKPDVDTSVDRTTKPQTLVCQKNIGSYQRALEEHKRKLAELAKVREIEGTLPG